MDPKTMLGLAATLGPLLRDLVAKKQEPEKLAAVEADLRKIEERLVERFVALERELLVLKVVAYGALAVAAAALGFIFAG